MCRTCCACIRHCARGFVCGIVNYVHHIIIGRLLYLGFFLLLSLGWGAQIAALAADRANAGITFLLANGHVPQSVAPALHFLRGSGTGTEAG